MINLTDSALNAVRNAISSANKPVDGLRIMVEAGGCAGYKYNLGLVDEIDPDDTVIERDGVRVFVDNKSHEYLVGTPSTSWWRWKDRASPSKTPTRKPAAAAASRSAEARRAPLA